MYDCCQLKKSYASAKDMKLTLLKNFWEKNMFSTCECVCVHMSSSLVHNNYDKPWTISHAMSLDPPVMDDFFHFLNGD